MAEPSLERVRVMQEIRFWQKLYIPALCGLGLNPAAVGMSNMLFELVQVEKNDIPCCLAAFLIDQLCNFSE